MTRLLFGFLAFSVVALLSVHAGESKLEPDAPYQATRSDPVVYDVDFSVVVTAPYHTKVLKVWLPLPQSDEGQEVTEGELTAFPAKVKPKIGTEPLFGNRFAYFEFVHPEGAQSIRHKFKVKVWEMRWNADPAKIEKVKKWPKSFDKYLRSEQAVVVDARFDKLAKDIVPKSLNAATDMDAVMAWVIGAMKYDHVDASLTSSSEHGLIKKHGHCSDYHGLCAALGRALKYPTRVTYGINPFPKNSPSHCKLEVFIPPHGWVSFDVAETQMLIQKIQKDKTLDAKKKEMLVEAAARRLRRGFRDNTWFLQTKGTDYDLVPPAAKKVPLVRTIYAEADGVALPEPDPANSQKKEFSWMTIHEYKADKKVANPFADWKGLLDEKK